MASKKRFQPRAQAAKFKVTHPLSHFARRYRELSKSAADGTRDADHIYRIYVRCDELAMACLAINAEKLANEFGTLAVQCKTTLNTLAKVAEGGELKLEAPIADAPAAGQASEPAQEPESGSEEPPAPCPS